MKEQAAAAAPTSADAAVLFGPTAAGKTELALQLAALLPLEVISADSRQVYRHLDVGTAKPTAAERATAPHHLVDCLELHETYDAARFAAETVALVGAIRARGRLPVLVGGAGFYLHMLRTGFFAAPYTAAALQQVRQELSGWSLEALQAALVERDPARAAAIHPRDRYRLSRALEICFASGSSVSALTAARQPPPLRLRECRLVLPRAELHRRIAARTTRMLHGGWIEEVRALLDAGNDPDLPGLRTLGYPHVVAHLQGRLTLTEVEELVLRDTRRFARHQEPGSARRRRRWSCLPGPQTTPSVSPPASHPVCRARASAE